MPIIQGPAVADTLLTFPTNSTWLSTKDITLLDGSAPFLGVAITNRDRAGATSGRRPSSVIARPTGGGTDVVLTKHATEGYAGSNQSRTTFWYATAADGLAAGQTYRCVVGTANRTGDSDDATVYLAVVRDGVSGVRTPGASVASAGNGTGTGTLTITTVAGDEVLACLGSDSLSVFGRPALLLPGSTLRAFVDVGQVGNTAFSQGLRVSRYVAPGTSVIATGAYDNSTAVWPSPLAVALIPTDASPGLDVRALATFAATAGEASPAAQAVALTNAGGGALTGLAIGAVDATLSPALAGRITIGALSSTTGPATASVTVDTTGLAAGAYAATAPVAWDGGTGTLTINVVVQPSPKIVCDARPILLGIAAGSATPATFTRQIVNGGGGTLTNLAVQSVTYRTGEPTGWLTATRSTTGAPSTLSGSCTATDGGGAALRPDWYHATVTLAGTNGVGTALSTIAVEVALHVQPTAAVGVAPVVTAVDGAGNPVAITPAFTSLTAGVTVHPSTGVPTATAPVAVDTPYTLRITDPVTGSYVDVVRTIYPNAAFAGGGA